MASLPTTLRRPSGAVVRATTAALVVALAAAACSSADGGSSATSSSAPATSSTTTSTVATDPGPGPTSLEGVTIDLDPVVTGLDTPTTMAARPGRNQLWIGQRDGTVRVVSVDTEWDKAKNASQRTGYTLLPGDVLDLTGLTTTDGERGLLGMAFSSDGRTLYVDHTAKNGDVVVASYAVEDRSTYSGGTSGTPPKVGSVVSVDPNSRQVLLTIPHSQNSNHNGGQLAFGPDGYLYIGVGDGGGSGDEPGNAQDPEVLLGKLLRIDPAAASFGAPYLIPGDNPFAGEGGRPEIYLWGVRNPWRFSFDRSNGDLWIGDVGQNAIEEINWLPARSGAGRGANLGWNWFEGDAPYRTDGTAPEGTVAPIATYDHDGGRCSITGGYVYRGTAVTALATTGGTYLYGDYCTGEIRGLLARKGIVLEDRALGVDVGSNNLVSFGQDDQGELYVLSSDGTLYAVVP